MMLTAHRTADATFQTWAPRVPNIGRPVSLWASDGTIAWNSIEKAAGRILCCLIKGKFIIITYFLQWHLLKVHNMHRGWRRRSRLAERARLLQKMDKALVNEGGPISLSYDELRWGCFFRGFNTVSASQADAITWLQSWLQISCHVDEKSLSLLLHAPVLLGYNSPSNWILLHDVRT